MRCNGNITVCLCCYYFSVFFALIFLPLNEAEASVGVYVTSCRWYKHPKCKVKVQVPL